MPNWCSTNIYINHKNKDKLKTFYDLIQKWTSVNYKKNGFGLRWLGNIVGNSGIDSCDEFGHFSIRCRGEIVDMDLHDDQITIYTETAWSPMVQLWVKVLERYLPDAELIYSAEETGCGIFWTNDPTLAGRYCIDSWNNDIMSDPELSESEAVKLLKEQLVTVENDIDTLIKMLEDSDIEDVSINKWEYVDVHDLD